MPSLSVRGLDNETYERLRRRAQDQGVSVEEEARRIIARAVAPPQRLSDLALELFGPAHGITVERPPRETHKPIRFDP